MVFLLLFNHDRATLKNEDSVFFVLDSVHTKTRAPGLSGDGYISTPIDTVYIYNVYNAFLLRLNPPLPDHLHLPFVCLRSFPIPTVSWETLAMENRVFIHTLRARGVFIYFHLTPSLPRIF